MALTEYYFQSDKITVFPSTRRNSESRRMSEAAIASIINKLIDKEDGFIITPRNLSASFPLDGGKLLEVDPDAPFEINIYGYYFKIDDLGVAIDMMNEKVGSSFTYNKIYANILLESKDDVTKKYPYTELAGVDNIQDVENLTGQYDGLRLTGNYPISKSSGEYQDFDPKFLLLFVRDSDGNWCVPDTSRFKFGWDSLDIKIDGGEIKNK